MKTMAKDNTTSSSSQSRTFRRLYFIVTLVSPVNTTANSYSWKFPFVVYFTMLSLARLYSIKW
jgi:hypothetical protein